VNPRINTDNILPKNKTISPSNVEACKWFTSAQRALYARDFASASNWMAKYRNLVRYDDFWRQDNRHVANPVLSVVIVAYKTNMDLITCIKSVLKGTRKDIEIIVVDNGGNELVLPLLLRMPLLYVQSPINLIPSEGRNIGVYYAKAPICAFLDDDAVVLPQYAEYTLAAFSVPDICAVRGKVILKTQTAYLGSMPHYDLGPNPLPHVINTEGNSAWRTDVYKDAGGMDPLLFGHEGIDLSNRLTFMFGKAVTFYWPRLVIRHDFAFNETKKDTKDARHSLMLQYLTWKGISGMLLAAAQTERITCFRNGAI